MHQETLTFWSEEHHASHSASQDCVEGLAMTEETLHSFLCEWLIISGQHGSSGKTSLASCRLMEDGTLAPSSGRWLNSGMGGRTGSWTLNTLESPRDAVESSLSDILQDAHDVPLKYFLSSTAAQGILRRAAKRNKRLPEKLQKALSLISNEQTSTGGGGRLASTLAARDYKSATDLIVETISPKTANCLQTTCHDYSRADGFNTVTYEANVRISPTGQSGEDYGDITDRSRQMGHGGGNVPIVQEEYAVRRLTPIEAERLQGFPDGYTDFRKKTPDAPRYKALGNSMAVPVMRWIGERINESP